MGKACIIWLLLIGQLFLWNGSGFANNGDLLEMLALEEGLEAKTIYQQTKKYGMMDKQSSKMEILKNSESVADLYLQTGHLQNGDLYFILRTEGKSKSDSAHTLELDLAEYITKPETVKFFQPSTGNWLEKPYGEGKIPRNFFVQEDGQTPAYFSLTEVYKRGEKVTLISDQSRTNQPVLKDGKLRISFYAGANQITEQWGMVSKGNLVDWDHQVGLEAIYLAEKYKWTMWGMYYPLPESYTPYYEAGYYYNPAQHVGESFLRKTDGGKFLEDFALVSLYNSAEMQNQHGFWWITTQSNWLYKDYSIPSTYYDSRWSTDAALFLLKGYQKYKDPAMLDAAVRYGEFLAEYASKHHFATKNGGILVQDYWHPMVDARVHSSLNHHVAEMNFLLELYIETGEAEYLDMARKMRQGVKDTASSYVNPQGDLWYGYMPDGTFRLKDYPLLTLLDLQKSQELWIKLDMAADPDLQFLIETKEAFREKLPENVR